MLSTQGMEIRIPEHIKQRADKALYDAWNDVDVKQFMKKHSDIIDDGMKERANSVILSFVQGKKNPLYKMELVIYANNIHCHETPNQTAGKQLADDGIVRAFKYDAITTAFNNITEYDDGRMGSLKAERFISNFIENYRYGSKLKGMWLHGERGIGKTYLTGYFTSMLKAHNIGFTFVNSAQLYKDMLDVQRNFNKDVNKNVWKIKNAQVLIMDDLGAEKVTDFMINDVMYEIVDYRMNRNLPTFCTSNYTKYDYEQYILDKGHVIPMDAARYKERLDTLMTEVLMTGINRRDKS